MTCTSSSGGHRVSRAVVATLLAHALLAGCAAMLPKGSTSARVGFDNFEAAEGALAQVVPYRTTLAELEAFGFKVRQSPNVVHVHYPDTIARLAPNSRVPLEELDSGIRDCIAARSACQVYEFQFAHQTQRRVGNFLVDFFNFRRETTISGWRFNALVVVKDDKVLFTSYGGEPRTDRVEKRTNPLGPLQATGEMSGGWIAR
jgi:hypothetical protein